MTGSSILKEVNKLIIKLWEASIARDSTSPIILSSGSGEFVTWKCELPLIDSFASLTKLEEYVYIVDNRNYSVMLLDGSVLQISYLVKNGIIKKHRLCFYPCPIEWEQSDLEYYENITGIIKDSTGDELRDRLRIRSSLRFDFDPDSEKDLHPASHLTLSRETCRIPVFAPLSIGHFIRFILLHFYQDLWQNNKIFRDWPCKKSSGTLRAIDRKHLYIQCDA